MSKKRTMQIDVIEEVKGTQFMQCKLYIDGNASVILMNKIDYDFWWEKIADYAKLVGRTTARPVLLLYYVLRSPETPSSDKMLIVAALSYLILPIDLISAKRLPVIGWIDEAFSLVYAYKKVCRYVTPEIESEVDNILERWFPEVKYELIQE